MRRLYRSLAESAASASPGACIAALDVGTTAVKACLFSPSLDLLACGLREYTLHTRGNRVEADGEQYMTAIRDSLAQAIAAVPGARVAAVGIATQGETLAPVDAEGRPLRPFLVWLDGRAGAEAEALSGVLPADAFYRETGLPEITGALPLAKLAWMRKNEPETFQRASQFMLLEDYLLCRLTGRRVSEKALQTSTGWFSLRRDALWPEALEAVGVGPERLPELVECGAPVGPLLPEAARGLGLPSGIPVVAGAMDQIAAALAVGGARPGAVTETTGTALVVTACTNAPAVSQSHRVTVYRHALKGRFLYLPIGNTAGMALKWFRDEFCKDLPPGGAGYAALDALAARAPRGSGGLVFLPFLCGCVDPDACPQARAVFFGARLSTTRAEFARSVMEAVAFMLADFLEMLDGLGCPVETVSSLGGGARSPLWQQMKADASGRELRVPACGEAAAMGAALLAGWGADLIAPGVYPVRRGETVYRPDPEAFDAYREARGLSHRLYCAVKPLYGP